MQYIKKHIFEQKSLKVTFLFKSLTFLISKLIMQFIHNMKFELKGHSFKFCEKFSCLFNYEIFSPYDDLDLHSYGQLSSVFL